MSVITFPAFAALMDGFELPSAPIAVGVSGGADSIFLALLLKKWADKKHIALVAVTVNHNLRSESKAEAKKVAVQMAAHGIEHHTLDWTGKKPTTRIEERARTARYELLQNFCASREIKHLFLAHHAQDQAETFFLRLTRGSGLDGLSAMNPVSQRGNLTLVRPLLSVSKKDILDTLKALHEPWVEDPMNRDTSFERVRWRTQLPALEKMGLSANLLYTTTKRLNRARNALDFYTQTFIDTHVTIENQGYARVETTAFSHLPLEIRLRVLARLLALIGQADKPLSMEALENALERLPTNLTLGECHLITHKNGLFIAKESARMAPPLKIPPLTWIKWDRFWVWSDVPATLRAAVPHKRVPGIPYLVQQSFPSFTPAKIPTLDYNQNIPYINMHIHFTPKNKG